MRRVFASAASAPAYSYDPYGNALQGTAPLTDFNYAGMFYNADSGLYLTQYRAYDPVAGDGCRGIRSRRRMINHLSRIRQ